LQRAVRHHINIRVRMRFDARN